MKPTNIDPRQYILSNVYRVTRDDELGECWEWAADIDVHGYGCAKGASSIPGHYNKAYRLAYIAFIGEIPDGLDLDHLCVNRPCVNPAHLDPVTRSENFKRAIAHHQARGTGQWNRLDVCTKGLHAMTDDNIYLQKVRQYVKRSCRECVRERQRKFLAENPDKVAKYQAARKAKQEAKRQMAQS